MMPTRLPALVVEHCELWNRRSAIAGMGVCEAVSSAVRARAVCPEPRGGTTGRCRGVMFTDVEHGHAAARRLDLGTATGTWGFDLLATSGPPAQSYDT